MNPISILPVFMTMTASMSHQQRRVVAFKAVLTAFITMLVFAFTGPFIFDFFNITSNGFRVVGGIIFFKMGYDMLNARLTRMKVEKKQIREYATDISITPLGIPMLCGPGAITNSILLMEQTKNYGEKGVLVATMVLICLAIMLVLWGGARITGLIGETGMKVMMRIMGLILMVVAVEYFFDGLTPMVREMLNIK